MKLLLVFGAMLLFQPAAQDKMLILTDQSVNRIVIVNTDTKQITWQWNAVTGGIHEKDTSWFKAPSDVKPVYNNTGLLFNASGGGMALVRIADHKTLFYAYAGGNTHSAEVLPDGNIVTASSTDNYLKIFRTDTMNFPDNVYSKKVSLPFAHNVVWDHKRNILWSAGRNKMYSLRYNFNCRQPDLTMIDSLELPDNDAHDLYPFVGKDSLWLTTVKHVYIFVPEQRKVIRVDKPFTENIKSVSSGTEDYPVAITIPKEQWWTDEVLDNTGKSIYKKEGLKIYKARWLIDNTFSYPSKDAMKICK